MGKNWAITIGINQYDNLTPLKYAKRDAEAMRDFCLKDMGFDRVYYFSDDSEPIATDTGPMKSRPTFATLSRFLRTRFEQPFLTPGDNLWFFFAGHGRRHSDRDYLMPIDVDPGNLDGTAISLNSITERLRRCGADNVILFLDACRDEGARDGEGIGLKQQGVITLFSCSPNERSYEIEALEQGAFTHVLLQGLRVQGEGNCATVERLYDYLKHQVPELNRKHQKPRQTPYAIAEPATKLDLILVPKFATSTDDSWLPSTAEEEENEKDFELDRNNQSPTSDNFPFLLTNNLTRRQFIGILGVCGIGGIWLVQKLGRAITPAIPPVVTPLQSFEFDVLTVNNRGKEVNRQLGNSQLFTEDLGNGVNLEMVFIHSDTYLVGPRINPEVDNDDSDGIQHKVKMYAFSMGKYLVTQAQWKQVSELPKVKRDLNPSPAHFKELNRPVEQVSWHDAVEFCDRLSIKTKRQFRLPSEEEWEYACRAKTTTPFHFGETLTPDLANYNSTYIYANGPKGKYRKETTVVGIFPPNAFGLYDMHGNVWEWCLDYWHDIYNEFLTLLENDAISRLVRGGSYVNSPMECRSSYRKIFNPVSCNKHIGFRVVCEAPMTL